MKKVSPVLTINPGLIDETFIDFAIKRSPNYNKKHADAIKRTIRCIHGLERFHLNPKYFKVPVPVRREQLEIYIGRATRATLKSRWVSHMKSKKHLYGMVLFSSTHEWVEDLEEIAIRILQKLKSRGTLCVKNLENEKKGKAGKKPRNEEAIVYMTWKYSETTSDWRKPGVKDISQIANEVSKETTAAVTKLQIVNGLQPLKSLNELDPLTRY
jgi:hypothetical protein